MAEEHEGASLSEQLIEACRRNNTDLLTALVTPLPDAQKTHVLNTTTTVLGNHLYHEAASRGHGEIIDLLLDQPDFECDPISRTEGDTPLHSVVRWINNEPPAQREYGNYLVEMMLEAGSNPRVKNKGGLTALQLVDPGNEPLKELIRRFEYASLNAGDFIGVENYNKSKRAGNEERPGEPEDGAFSGSDEEERAEWERRRKGKAR